MIDIEKKIWGIHARDEDLFLRSNKIAIGWKKMGNLLNIPDNREDFKSRFIQMFPEAKKGSVPTSVGMLHRFCHEVQIGDLIVFPSKSDRMVNIGEVTGEYTYDDNAYEYAHQREVKWMKHIPRTALSQGALYDMRVKSPSQNWLQALENFI